MEGGSLCALMVVLGACGRDFWPPSPQGPPSPGRLNKHPDLNVTPKKGIQRKGHSPLTGDHLIPENLIEGGGRRGETGRDEGLAFSWDLLPGKKHAFVRTCWESYRCTERNLSKLSIKIKHNKNNFQPAMSEEYSFYSLYGKWSY